MIYSGKCPNVFIREPVTSDILWQVSKCLYNMLIPRGMLRLSQGYVKIIMSMFGVPTSQSYGTMVDVPKDTLRISWGMFNVSRGMIRIPWGMFSVPLCMFGVPRVMLRILWGIFGVTRGMLSLSWCMLRC